MQARELANSICDTLENARFQAFLVGGCVRDILLEREPADYDVATNATPEQVLKLFPGGLAVGAQFGVILVPGDGIKVEVATFRSDLGYSDGRHPDGVVYANSPQEDVKRRDFTINGLVMRHDTGEILDFVDGQADLRAGIIRAIGEPGRRFAEDKLRMLRAVRFAARFGYEIEPETFKAIRKHAREISQVSAERIREELTKLVTEGAARRGFELLDSCWLLSIVLPEIAALTWGVLLHDVGKPSTFRSAAETGDRIRFDGHVDVGIAIGREILGRLRFSNDDTEQILSLVEHHMKFKDVKQMRPATLKRFVRLPRFEEHMALHRLDCLSSHRNLEAYEFVESFLRLTPPEVVRPAKLVTGEDVLRLGYAPGPLVGKILAEVEEAQLNGELASKEDAVAFLMGRFRQKEGELKKSGR